MKISFFKSLLKKNYIRAVFAPLAPLNRSLIPYKPYQGGWGGFTLVELLIASFIGGLVIAGAGFGLVNIVTANEISEAKTQRRLELNRAIEFLSEEIRMSNKISSASGGTFPGSGTGVLLLDIADDPDDTNPNRVYFIRSSTPTWIDNYTINRASSDYSSSISVSSPSDKVLVDALDAPSNIDPSSTEVTDITADCTGVSGTFLGANGFYACLYSDNRTVDLYMYGRLSKDSNQYIKVATKVFARAQ